MEVESASAAEVAILQGHFTVAVISSDPLRETRLAGRSRVSSNCDKKNPT
jgi:hypothetical protein